MRRVCAGFAMALLLGAAPQSTHNPEASAREYVQFLVLQLEQWSEEFPRQFYLAVMRPPVDAGKLSESGKAASGELGDSIKRLSALAGANDILTNAGFRDQLNKTLGYAKEVNQVMGAQRFPVTLRSSWEQIRSTMNNLARVYKIETLAVLDAPGSGGGRRGRGGKTAGTATAAGAGLSGYIVDLSCAKRGKGMWANPDCVAKCVRDGDKLVLVTAEGKIYQISNQDKITPDSYGQMVTLTGRIETDSISLEMLKM